MAKKSSVQVEAPVDPVDPILELTTYEPEDIHQIDYKQYKLLKKDMREKLVNYIDEIPDFIED